jgi:hypothetical protein
MGGEGATSDCGDGALDAGEECDEHDLGGATCASFGYIGGELACLPSCHFDARACIDRELLCANGLDDDDNGLVDCDDAACAGDPKCLDPCALPIAEVAPSFMVVATTDGRPDLTASSCLAGAATELILAFVAPETGTYQLQAFAIAADLALSVRSDCADPASEVACAQHAGSFFEAVSFSATAGATHYIVVENASGGPAGYFGIEVRSDDVDACAGIHDDDLDGLIGAADPDCATSLGNLALGEPCSQDAECDATAGDPLCLHGVFANKYCSEHCDALVDPCPGAAVCAPNAALGHGVCLEACSSTSDCVNGFVCSDTGAGDACTAPAEICDDGHFNVWNAALLDCDDPACRSDPACAAGEGEVGAPCAVHADCAANDDDPYCDDFGRCTEFCVPDDCPSGSFCFLDRPWKAFHSHGRCVRSCESDADCDGGSCRTFETPWVAYAGVTSPKGCEGH